MLYYSALHIGIQGGCEKYMRVQLTGKNLEVGQCLREHIKASVGSHVTKYFRDAINAKVVIHKGSYQFNVNVIVNEGISHGAFIKASGASADPYMAANTAITRVTNKLRRYKYQIIGSKKGVSSHYRTIA